MPAIYPLLKTSFNLNFAQIGLITLTYQTTASLLQPLIGFYTDKNPRPYSLPVGMGATLVGLILLSIAHTFPALLVAAALVGTGSSVFHPESSRVARMASGGQHGLAQSLFQVGGNAGLSLGPLLAAFVVMPRGQTSIAWFTLAALLGMILLTGVSSWAKKHRSTWKKFSAKHVDAAPNLSTAPDHGVHRDPDGAAVFQVCLPGQSDQLLHVLFDQQVSRCRCRARRFTCSFFSAPLRRAR